MSKKTALFLAFFFMLTSMLPLSAVALTAAPDIEAKQAYIVNLETGRVMYAENETERTATGGFAKLMTILLALEKAADVETVVTVSPTALVGLEDATTANLKAGEQLSLKDLIYCISVRSAADASNVVAEYIGGSIEGFVTLMNQRAAELGCTNTHFTNTYGGDDADAYTTAYDLYLLTKAAMENPLFMNYVNLQYKYIQSTNMSPDRTYYSTNKMIVSNPDQIVYDYYLKYARGIMSSLTNNSGYSLITSIRKDDVNYICIVMNSIFNTQTKRRGSYIDAKALCNWVLDNYKSVRMLEEKQPVTQVPVALSTDTDSIVLVSKEDYYTIIPSDATAEKIEQKIILKKPKLKAPIAKDEDLGTVEFYYIGEKYGEETLIAQNDVSVNTVLFVMDRITTFFGTLYFKLIIVLVILGSIGYGYLTVKLNRRNTRKDAYRRRRY